MARERASPLVNLKWEELWGSYQKGDQRTGTSCSPAANPTRGSTVKGSNPHMLQ